MENELKITNEENSENQNGKKVLALRRKYGLSQKEFAKFLNVNYRNISKWETGTRNPSDQLINMMERIFALEEELGRIQPRRKTTSIK